MTTQRFELHVQNWTDDSWKANLTDAQAIQAFDHIRLHVKALSRLSSLRTEAARVGKRVRFTLYGLPQFAISGETIPFSILPDESYYLHNPEGSLDRTKRVRYIHNKSTRTALDFRQKKVRDLVLNYLMSKYINLLGLDGYWQDSPSFSMRDPAGWVVAPTEAQKVLWLDGQQAWAEEMRAALGVRRFFWNNLRGYFAVYRARSRTDLASPQGQAVIAAADNHFIEGYGHARWLCVDTGISESHVEEQQTLLLEQLVKGKQFSGQGSTANRRHGVDRYVCDGVSGTLAEWTAWRWFGFWLYMLLVQSDEDYYGITNSPPYTVESHLVWLAAAKSIKFGPPMAAASKVSGLWQRPFSGGLLRVNLNPSSTIGSLAPQTGRFG